MNRLFLPLAQMPKLPARTCADCPAPIESEVRYVRVKRCPTCQTRRNREMHRQSRELRHLGERQAREREEQLRREQEEEAVRLSWELMCWCGSRFDGREGYGMFCTLVCAATYELNHGVHPASPCPMAYRGS